MFWTQGKGFLATKYIRDYWKNSRTTWLICNAKKWPFSLELQVLVSPILVIPSPVSMSLGSQIRHRRLWVAMESDHWQVDGVDWGWLFVQWALSSTDLSSSETRILLYTSLCVSLCLTPLDPVCQLLLSWLSISLSTYVLSAGPSPNFALTPSLETENHPAGYNQIIFPGADVTSNSQSFWNPLFSLTTMVFNLGILIFRNFYQIKLFASKNLLWLWEHQFP